MISRAKVNIPYITDINPTPLDAGGELLPEEFTKYNFKKY